MMSTTSPAVQVIADDEGIESPRLVLRPLLQLDEEQFFELVVQNRDLRLEQDAQGAVIIVPLHNPYFGLRNADISCQLGNWDRDEKHGVTFCSGTPFRFANGAARRPDASWVENERWERLTEEEQEKIAQLTPNFVIELRSETDRLVDLQAKLAEYIDNGVELGWIVDPLLSQVHIYEGGKPVQILDRPATVVGTGCMQGFVLDLKDIFSA
jgi:Uma2 family endonuclease